MDEPQLLALKPELDRFLDRFAPLFGRDENQAHARRFVQGLLHGGERRNAENIAQAMSRRAGPVPPGLPHHRRLAGRADPRRDAPSGAGGAGRRRRRLELRRDRLPQEGDQVRRRQAPVLRHPGPDRQLPGRRLRQLLLDQGATPSWTGGCSCPRNGPATATAASEAGVPPGVIFRTKPQLALEMVAEAVDRGVPFRWVGGDGVYGDSPTFVQGRAPARQVVRPGQLGRCPRLDRRAPGDPARAEAQAESAGGPCTQPLVVGEARRVDEVVAALPAAAWRRLTVAEGSQGPRVYEYAEVWAWFSEEGLPGPRERLLVRRSLGQEPELKYHRSNAPAEVPLLKLAQVRATRWTIEEDIKSGKGQCGLDEYETRGWSGWHHHTALSMLALAFLVLQRRRVGGKRAGDDGARGAGAAGPPAGGARLGRGRDPRVVGLASGEESPSGRRPSQAATRRAKASPAK